jgi:hypothetical protein
VPWSSLVADIYNSQMLIAHRLQSASTMVETYMEDIKAGTGYLQGTCLQTVPTLQALGTVRYPHLCMPRPSAWQLAQQITHKHWRLALDRSAASPGRCAEDKTSQNVFNFNSFYSSCHVHWLMSVTCNILLQKHKPTVFPTMTALWGYVQIHPEHYISYVCRGCARCSPRSIFKVYVN